MMTAWKCPRCTVINAPWLPQCYCKEPGESSSIVMGADVKPVIQTLADTISNSPKSELTEKKNLDSEDFSKASLCPGCKTIHSVLEPCAREPMC